MEPNHNTDPTYIDLVRRSCIALCVTLNLEFFSGVLVPYTIGFLSIQLMRQISQPGIHSTHSFHAQPITPALILNPQFLHLLYRT